MRLKIFEQLFKDYYWDFKTWLQSIPIDTHISIVKEQLPNYVIVDWQNPERLGDGFLYPLLKIKGHRKTNATDFLGFVEDLYSGHIFRK